MQKLLTQNQRSITFSSDKKIISLSDRVSLGLAVVLFGLISSIFVYFYVSDEHFIYYWDYVGYWAQTRQIIHDTLQDHNFKAFVKFVFLSIRHSDYNLLPVVPVAILSWLLGSTSRVTYILITSLLYSTSVVYLFSLLIKHFQSEYLSISTSNNRRWLPIGILTIALLPLFWAPILRGMPDVGGLGFIFGVYLLYFKKNQKNILAGAVSTGILLAILYLFRRWYLFWIISFFIAVTIDGLIASLSQKENRFHNLKAKAKYLAACLLMFSLLIFCIATPLVLKVLSTNYGDIYSAYKVGESQVSIAIDLFKDLGWIFDSISICAFCSVLFSPITRRIGLFFLIQEIFIISYFSSIQYFDIHHKYLVISGILPVIGIFILQLSQLPSRTKATVGLLTFVIIGAAQMFLSFDRQFSHMAEKISPFLSHQSLGANATGDSPFYNLQRSDLPEFLRLLATIDRETANPKDSFYVLASSRFLNSALFQNADSSLHITFKSKSKLIETSNVDKRDGFPYAALSKATLIVVGIPIQYHLRPDDQTIIGYPVNEFIQGKGIAKAFIKLNYAFHLDSGVTVYLYKKSRPIQPKDFEQIKERLRARYPNCDKYHLC